MDKLIEIEKRSASEKTHLQYLKYLYSTAEIVKSEPHWESCFNIAMPKEDNIVDHLDVILNTAAGKLQHSNTIAVKIAKMDHVIFVKTENQNA